MRRKNLARFFVIGEVRPALNMFGSVMMARLMSCNTFLQYYPYLIGMQMVLNAMVTEVFGLAVQGVVWLHSGSVQSQILSDGICIRRTTGYFD